MDVAPYLAVIHAKAGMTTNINVLGFPPSRE